MFTAAGKLWQYLWGVDQSELNCQSIESTEAGPDDGAGINRREIVGTVTHVDGNNGLIDNEIYFSLDHVIGRVRPSVNAKVSVVAMQQYEGGGWYAEQVLVTEDWEEDSDKCDKSVQELSLPTEIIVR